MIVNILFLSSGVQKIFEPLPGDDYSCPYTTCFTILFVFRYLYVPVYYHKRGSSLLVAHGVCLHT